MFVEIGSTADTFFAEVGLAGIMTFQAFAAIRKTRNYTTQIVEQFIHIGRKSLPLIIVTSTFVGLAIGVQVGFQMTGFTPHWMAGGMILRTILIDLGPITIGLVLSGRISAGVAAELGTMKVTEQVEALRSFGIDPIDYLIMPRLVAAMFAVPVLLVYSNFIAMIPSYYSCHMTIGLSWNEFTQGMRYSFYAGDLDTSLIKGFVFGIVIVISGSFFGLNSQRGAKGVGTAATQAVVWASVSVFILDYLISAILFYI
ncbi:MAG TPA: ABC transporter permease [Candidatus Kryptobacter bacterium]|nr:ABC transporter permease [Candidatus Kryptobacter bacterium]